MDVPVDVWQLEERATAGLLRRAQHPTADLWIYNYTERCAYEGAWDDYTRACRGLILGGDGGIVARPFPKFFNYGERHAADLDLDAPVAVTDKLDGSLGILYRAPDGWAVATRGSFTSDQAIHATALLRGRYDGWAPPVGLTCLFEIIYPANRIVVDYRGLDDLVYLGALSNATGLPEEPYPPWPGPRADTHPYSSLRQALEAEPRPGQEGLVVYFPHVNDRLKLKQADYLAVHRIVFGLTARSIWERLATRDLHGRGYTDKQIGRTLMIDVAEVEGILAGRDDWQEEMLEIVPEEFGDWISDTVGRIAVAIEVWTEETASIFRGLAVTAADRKAAAAAITEHAPGRQPEMFVLLDGKDPRHVGWRAVRPGHDRPSSTEDAE